MSNRAVQRRESLMKARGQHIPGSRPSSSSFSSPSTPSYAQHPSAAYPVQQPQQNQPPLNAFQQQQLQMQQAQQQQQRQMMMQQQQQQQQPIINTVTTPAVQPQVTSATPVTTSFMTYETFLELYQKQSDENAKQTQALISCINELKTGIVRTIQTIKTKQQHEWDHEINEKKKQDADQQKIIAMQQEKEKHEKFVALSRPGNILQPVNAFTEPHTAPMLKVPGAVLSGDAPVSVAFTAGKRGQGNSSICIESMIKTDYIKPPEYIEQPNQEKDDKPFIHAELEPETELEQSNQPAEQHSPKQSEPSEIGSPLKESITVSPIFEVTPVSIVPPVV